MFSLNKPEKVWTSDVTWFTYHKNQFNVTLFCEANEWSNFGRKYKVLDIDILWVVYSKSLSIESKDKGSQIKSLSCNISICPVWTHINYNFFSFLWENYLKPKVTRIGGEVMKREVLTLLRKSHRTHKSILYPSWFY